MTLAELAAWTVARSVSRLPEAAKRNLRYHVTAGTPMACGETAGDWTDGAGGAQVALLAVTKDPPVNPVPQDARVDQGGVLGEAGAVFRELDREVRGSGRS